MKNIIQILFVSKLAGIAKKTGNAYDMRMAQCVIERNNPETGAPEPLIGELVLPEKFKDTVPGRYEVEFGIAVDQAKRVMSVVVGMIPAPAGRAAPAVAPAASKA